MKSKANTDMQMGLSGRSTQVDFLVSFPLNIRSQMSCVKTMLLRTTIILLPHISYLTSFHILCSYSWKQNTVGHILKLLEGTDFIVH